MVSTLQIFFFENERLRLVDQRLETIASSLIASGLSLNMIQNLESTDDLINDLLGEERVDHIINVYSDEGEVLAQNYTATEIPLRFTTEEAHQTYPVKNLTVRVLNIKKGRLVVQVGVVLGPSLLNRWSVIANARFFWFMVFVFLLLISAAFFSSGVLFRPLRALTLELQSMSAQLERKLGQSLSGFVIGPELSRLSRGHRAKDEFELLCAEIESFLKKLEGYTRSFNAQTAILTHELKTPLTILKNYLQELTRARDLKDAQTLGQGALLEIDRLTQLINDYLQWSVLTSNPGQPNEIYAVKLSEIAGKAVSDLNAIHAQRLKLVVESEALIFAMPDHTRQLVSNLLSNALHYSPPDKPVLCRITAETLEVIDQGPGLPAEVRAHLGSPFNRGDLRARDHKSSGLGLAWVSSLCEKYSWKLDIQSSPEGTSITVTFQA